MIFDKWENLQNFSFSQEWNDIINDVLNLRKEVLDIAFKSDFENLSAREFLDAFQEKSYSLRHHAFLNTMAFFPKKENVYEAHRKFVDIHFVIHGQERIEIASTSDILAQKAYNTNDIYNSEKDFIFFTKPYAYQACALLDTSHFLLAMPEDAHATCLAPWGTLQNTLGHNNDECGVTVKGIVKIPVEFCI